MKFFDLMKRAANEAGLELTELQYEQFIKYMRLLQEWNEKINLTAIGSAVIASVDDDNITFLDFSVSRKELKKIKKDIENILPKESINM